MEQQKFVELSYSDAEKIGYKKGREITKGETIRWHVFFFLVLVICVTLTILGKIEASVLGPIMFFWVCLSCYIAARFRKNKLKK